MGTQINLTPDMVKYLLPKADLFPTKNIWDSLPKPKKGGGLHPSVNNLLPLINKIQMNWIQLRMLFIEGKEFPQKANPGHDDIKYLEYPSSKIKNFVKEVVGVKLSDTNDEKAYKIMRWVQDMIEYKSDIKNYGQMEWWTTPSQTLNRMSGDCEDGAFLMHSMMLNAGIPWDQIRTYGGSVMVGQGAATGGHGWTAYKRETDDEWVVLDWCYYPNTKQIADRTTMRYDIKYIDDWFYIDTHASVDTPWTNKVRNPGAMAYNTVPKREFVIGQRLNIEA